MGLAGVVCSQQQWNHENQDSTKALADNGSGLVFNEFAPTSSSPTSCRHTRMTNYWSQSPSIP